MKAPFRDYDFEKDISGCGIFGVIHRKKGLIGGDMPIKAMCTMHDRGNGLGGGFAAYGIYPDMADYYAFHVMATSQEGLDTVEAIIKRSFDIHESHPIPTRKTLSIKNPPIVWRFFVSPKRSAYLGEGKQAEENFVAEFVLDLNVKGYQAGNAYFLFSSGKDMGAFKGVGFPEDIAEFFRLDEYKGYIWTGHNRFPTNTPGWWGGAHPFTLLDWSIVHNGEISSYGINKRYLQERGYICTLMTDTEVVAYLVDLLIRKHGMSMRMASHVFAPPFWDEIARMSDEDRKTFTALRQVYGSAMLNGPFAILIGQTGRLMGLNDRVKLRPLLVAEKGDMTFLASEESSIREVSDIDSVWAPKACEPVIVDVEV